MEIKSAETNLFKRDRKRMDKRGYNLDELKAVVAILKSGETLPSKYRDHSMDGMPGLRNCHIQSDWVLLYRYSADKTKLILERTVTPGDFM
ncbi:hypothetical protein AGMMS49959_12620 [Planctomycetales bacterium]|nr:hypothetical protein AGMMS49959_12620 [Planctomycetales bacterium]